MDDFYSGDLQHHVVWEYNDKVGYETWMCETHTEPYYLVCVYSLSDDAIVVENA